MRTSPLSSALQTHNPTTTERFGVQVVETFSDIATEYRHIREHVGVTDFSCMQLYRVPEETGIDFLDTVVAGNVARIRFGRVLHTFIANDEGEVIADCYVANNDDELVVMCESIVKDEVVDGILLSSEGVEAGVEKLTGNEVVIGIDGFESWKVVKELFGTDVLGLPYLSLEVYPFEGTDIRLIRAGKTSEFGYLLTAPVAVAESLLSACLAGAENTGGGLCGVAVHGELRLEGRFFNVFAEGARVGDPLEIGLQWMIDFDKDNYQGSQAILARREQGVTHKVVGVQVAADLTVGDAVFDEGTQVGDVVAACHSFVLDAGVGLARLPVDIAYSGVEFMLGAADGAVLTTISMPPIIPKSLTVKLDEM